MSQLDDFLRIIFIMVITFFVAFAKELNKREQLDEEYDFGQFIASFLIQGILGSLMGFIVMLKTKDLVTLAIASIIGGFLGDKTLKIALKQLLVHSGLANEIKAEDFKIDENEKKKDDKEDKKSEEDG